MAGLMGALVSGAVGGYAKQRVADIDEQEKFDFANALADADFNRRALLQEMGYKQSLELEDRRDQRQISSDERRLQNQMDVSDHNLENNMALKDYELDAAQEANQKERDRMAGYAEGAESLTEVQDNIIRGGELDAKTIASMGGDSNYKDTNVGGEIVRTYRDGRTKVLYSGDGASGGKSGNKSEKGWNETTRQVQNDINKAIERIDGMSDNFGGDPKDTKLGREAKKLGGAIYRNNKGLSISEVADLSARISAMPEEERFFIKSNGTESYRIKGVRFEDGRVVYLDDKLYPVEKPNETKSQSEPKQVQQSEPSVKPQNNATGLMQSAQQPRRMRGGTSARLRSDLLGKENELAQLTRSLSRRTRYPVDKDAVNHRIAQLNVEIEALRQQIGNVNQPQNATSTGKYR